MSDCNVVKLHATSVSDLVSVRPNNNTSTTTRQCNVKTILERQSSRTTSTRQCNVNTLLERQVISTTPTRHATIIN